MKVKGKVFIVSGAGGGIGGAVAEQLIKMGARVAVVDLNKSSLNKLKSKHAQKIQAYPLDLTDRKAVKSLPNDVIKNFGQLDGVVHCAGIIQPFVKFNELSFDDIDRVLDVNLGGSINLLKSVLPVLLERPEAHIVNTSSMGGFLPVPGQSIYGASKAGLKLLSEALYAELLYTNIGVSTVFPGATATDITKNSGIDIPSGQDSKDSDYKMLSPEEVAQKIIRGIEKNQPNIYTGSDSKLMNKLYRLSPVFAVKTITKKMKSLLGN